MDIKEIHKKLVKQCPYDYKINEIIPFAYPFRRVRINATVNKSPEKSIQQVYSVLLRSIQIGCNTEIQIINFLGLHKEDFILRELYFLRERGFVDFVSGVWLVTEQGQEFIKDNSILKVLEEVEYEFLIDTITNDALQKEFRLFSDKKTENKLQPEFDFGIKSPELLNNKSEQISDIYKKENKGKAYLVDFDKSNILFDKKEYQDFYLIEYIPNSGKANDLEPRIEIRNTDKDYSLDRRLTKILSNRYPSLLYDFTNSERASIARIENENTTLVNEFKVSEKPEIETQTLSIWETQAKFEESLKTVKKRILIESPWIKQATLRYVGLMEKALTNGVTIYILYGIEGNDEHHRKAEKEMERLQREHKGFNLIHLPTHFESIGNYQMTGTHRKLVIKDDEFFIQGSFNFLSFNKKEGQKVANEESILITKNIDNKWNSVFEEYEIRK
ncbi:hypothetical protein RCC89_19665 [Cytophagaceae bacterium ABcell3]|nr:hypothetical protein RCC89_19665 [Cytophagaceae bacterium ABcell3]